MRAIATVPSCLLAIALLEPIAAQTANGTVLGFDGKPASDAVVFARTRHGRGVDVPTREDGSFALQCAAPIVRLWVELAGARKDLPLVDGHGHAVHATFVDVPHHHVRGRLVLPDGTPAVGVEVRCQGKAGETLLTVATDASGEFRALLGAPPQDVVVDPIGWALRTEVTADGSVVVDLRRERAHFFLISGRVLDERSPLANATVRASGAGCVVSTRAGPDGRYRLWSNRPIESLDVSGANPIRRKGRFTTNATAVDLDTQVHGLVLVRGQVLAADGTPAAATVICGVEHEGPPSPTATVDAITDMQGRFHAWLPRSAKFVHARQGAGDPGACAPVPGNGERIEVRLPR